ncbi:MAG: TonB-dependent receptor, partial [Acidobacteria bacterium]|nr:TonB-dependent receptor [Acidobacteriota bacterium]
VLWDGIPANDPFGGWVYWNRLAPEELERIEVLSSASTSVFGDRALAGVIGLTSRQPETTEFTASYFGGNRNTHDLGAGAQGDWQRWKASARLHAFSTDGWYITPQRFRGSIDRPSSVEFITGATRLDYLTPSDRAFLRFDVLAEDRANGTVLQNNSTGLGTLAGHYMKQLGGNELSLVAWHTREQFHSTFSAIATDRNSERLTYTQRVPAEDFGGALLWQRTGSWWSATAGADAQRSHGLSIDSLSPTGLRQGGGTLLRHGVFAQTRATRGLITVFLGARYQEDFLSPNAGLVVGRSVWRLRGSVNRGFRAPTLNELYREFRAGNAVTQANPLLTPERSLSGEAGGDLLLGATRASVTAYHTDLEGLITNVTLSSTPAQIIRQRRNSASALARGVQFELAQKLGDFRLQAGYLYAESRLATGPRIAQVPHNQITGEILYSRGGTLASIGTRGCSMQFDDDLNTLRLPGFTVFQAVVRREISKGLSAVVSVENALNRTYYTGFSPTPAVGTPRLIRAGLRWQSRVPPH